MSSPFDVVVVGGGPAGASTAIACAARGLHTLLLEAADTYPEQPGETLHPGLEPLFRLLGVDAQVNRAGFLRHPGYRVHTAGESVVQAYGSDHRGTWLGYQANRSVLNTLLLERVAARGVIVRQGERATAPVMSGGSVAGVATASERHSARYVVDAAGSARWLERRLAIPGVPISPQLIARYGWLESTQDHEHAVALPEFRAAQAAWTWTAPVGPHRSAWVTLDLEGKRNPTPSVPSKSDSTQSARPGARDVTWRIARPSAGPGYFLAGDAAWVLDPASSHGVLKAIMSGIMVADSIGRIVHGAAQESAIQQVYRAWAENWFCADAASLISLYSRMDEPPSWLSAASDALRYIASSPSLQPFSTNPTKR